MSGHKLEGVEESDSQGSAQRDNVRRKYSELEKYLAPIRTKRVQLRKQ
jgi:hypothetical protein